MSVTDLIVATPVHGPRVPDPIMDNFFTCKNRCCLFMVANKSSNNYRSGDGYYSSRQKAGAFIYDKELDSVLLVQSRGAFWGVPKGGLEENESFPECAVREVKEETGLDIVPTDFLYTTKVQQSCMYYYIEKSASKCQCRLDLDQNNDANGIVWIKVECLKEMVESQKLNLNYQTKILFRRFLNVDFLGKDNNKWTGTRLGAIGTDTDSKL